MSPAPASLGVPPEAMDAYRDLLTEIHRQGMATPCASDPDSWTGTQQQQEVAARACLDCPVFAECARYANQANEVTATWAGLTARERRERFNARNTTRGAA